MRFSMFTKGALALSALFALAAATTAQAQFKYWNVDSASHAPKTLSATGLYTNISTKAMITSAIPFEVNSALWSDGSAKKRWVLLKTGTKIGFQAMDDYWTYPDSTVFIKQFAIDTVPGDTLNRRIWETRLLILKRQPSPDTSRPDAKADKWFGFSYRWRKNGLDADLVPLDTGFKDTVGWYPAGRGTQRVLKKWVYPSSSDCNECHSNYMSGETHARTVLGFFAAQLNRPSPSNPGVNQI